MLPLGASLFARPPDAMTGGFGSTSAPVIDECSAASDERDRNGLGNDWKD